MDISDLRSFLAVAEQLSFRRAAEQLHLAQPALSRTIMRLERELDTRLFDRDTRSVALTATGKSLVGPARDVLDGLKRAELAVQASLYGEAGLVRIAFTGVSTHRLLGRLARMVRSEKPGIELQLYTRSMAQPAMRALLACEHDIALGWWDVVPNGVSTRVVRTDSLVFAMPDTHLLAGESSIRFERLVGDPFVSLPPYSGSVLVDRLRRLAEQYASVPDIVQIAPDTQTALALVSAEVGCLLTIDWVARTQTDTHVAFVPVEEAGDLPDVNLRAAWRTDDQAPALQTTLAMLFALCPQDQVVEDSLRPDTGATPRPMHAGPSHAPAQPTPAPAR